MFLSNETIRKYIETGKIKVTGDLLIESMGIGINLGKDLLIPMENQTVGLSLPAQPQYTSHNLLEAPYTLKPNEFVLGSTEQLIYTSKDIATMLDGRSTLARLGLTIHLSAMVLDGVPFSNESSVLEIKNLGNFNIVLNYKDRVGTYIFAQLTDPITGEKDTAYANQNGVTPPII